jgi:hypothetical protein
MNILKLKLPVDSVFTMKKLIICVLYSLPAVICFSQTTPQQTPKIDMSRLEFGGNLGVSWGRKVSAITIAPQVGYIFDPNFSAGIGVNYSYYRYSPDSYNSTSLNYMGLNTYGRIRPFYPLVLQIQPEIYRMWGSSYGSSVSQIVPTLLLGGGVILPVGSISLMLYYDVVQNKYSPYGNGFFFSVGYIVTL